ncbi:TIR domain-containing protein [Aquihabitans sp. McL0605]|uniref:TIR domain-containing protein n=1 Tax=Aquihabitans sp. McL0605 TaxID=3415671 RepID=UPI003CFA6E3D
MKKPEMAFIFLGSKPSVLRDVGRLIHTATSLEASVFGAKIDPASALIERYADPADPSCVVIIILTGDDYCRVKARPLGGWEQRPNQDVILSLGYFVGRLPEQRVIVLHERNVVGPGMVEGVTYLCIEDSDLLVQLARSLERCGATIDYSLIPERRAAP